MTTTDGPDEGSQTAGAQGAGEHGAHGAGDHGTHGSGGHGAGGHGAHEAGVHGMLVFGLDTVYLSHFPMFGDAAHNIQAILEVDLHGPAHAASKTDVRTAYATDRQQSGERIYSVQPTTLFVLTEFVAGPGETPKRHTFEGDLFRGHFERPPNRRLAAGVTFTVKQALFFAALDPDAAKPADIDYILFGKGQEHFLAHRIAGAPDFDQVLAAELMAHEFDGAALERGVILTLHKRPNTIASRLKKGETASGHVHVHAAEGIRHLGVTVRITEEIYFEETELRMQADFGQSRVEKQAGF